MTTTTTMTTTAADTVAAMAELTLAVWRAAGVSDADILTLCSEPDDYADTSFEVDQLIRTGWVYAPADETKAAMRALLLAGAVSPQ
jgi:hypothetical protein